MAFIPAKQIKFLEIPARHAKGVEWGGKEIADAEKKADALVKECMNVRSCTTSCSLGFHSTTKNKCNKLKEFPLHGRQTPCPLPRYNGIRNKGHYYYLIGP